jgi:gas vesicle protein GvpG
LIRKVLLIDDLICAPGKFVLWILRQVHEAAKKELEQESEHITLELAELHRHLESGMIREPEFDARERELLDRLEELNGRSHSEVGDSGEDIA